MSDAQLLSDYERDGCIRIRGFLTPERVAEVRKNLERYIRDILPGVPEGARVFEADGKAVRNLWNLEKYDPWFDEFARDPKILELIGKLVHGEPLLVAVETFNKPARIGSGVPHHQDNAYFCQSPPDMLTLWIALDPATMENGPIYYVKGSHKNGTKPHHASGVKGNSMLLSDAPVPDPAKEMCGTLNSGDALIHHCQTIHYSAPNKSDQPRCGFLLVYKGSHTREDPALREAYRKANAKV